ncbi:7871_t:CDS:1 [Dentiscutata erythropus]|uniref:7871_t:CDS:1 n=1 Tax=Dentiscutata erythropus TaxID=1348616 RepID=A0A9N9IN63_9GLOM|nr:7871_t:CDS:1 [Dentiscutata erythropus]
MWSFLFLILLNSLQVKGGSQFSNCVGGLNYQGIINYVDNSSNNIFTYGYTFGCFNGKCTGFPTPFAELDITFQCNNLTSQSRFCITTGSNTNGAIGGLCGGILGDTPATSLITNESTIGCPSLDAVSNALRYGPTTDTAFTWLCCASNNCVALNNVTVNNGWATTNCGHGYLYNSLMCFTDNGGWTCAGGQDNVVAVNKKAVSSMFTGISSTSVNKCILQVGGIGFSSNLLSSTSNGSNISNLFNSNAACEVNRPILIATTIFLAALLLLAIILVFYYRHQYKKLSMVYQDTKDTKGYLSQVVDSST